MRILQSLMMLALLGLAVVCNAAGPADGYELMPVPDAGVRWDAVGISVIFLAATAVVGFKNAKRTHLD
jgi:hypothetical protein